MNRLPNLVFASIQIPLLLAVETIGYRMPAFRVDNIFIYFAAFKKHLGIYPPVTGDKELRRELTALRGPRGNLKFALDQPIPYDLIGRVVTALSHEYSK